MFWIKLIILIAWWQKKSMWYSISCKELFMKFFWVAIWAINWTCLCYMYMHTCKNCTNQPFVKTYMYIFIWNVKISFTLYIYKEQPYNGTVFSYLIELGLTNFHFEQDQCLGNLVSPFGQQGTLAISCKENNAEPITNNE